MKNKSFLAVIAIIMVAAGVYYFSQISSTTEYQAEPTPAVTEPVQMDQILEAQKQLDEAKKILDLEENGIKEDIKKSEARLEEIRQVRLSFSQAPGQVQ